MVLSYKSQPDHSILDITSLRSMVESNHSFRCVSFGFLFDVGILEYDTDNSRGRIWQILRLPQIALPVRRSYKSGTISIAYTLMPAFSASTPTILTTSNRSVRPPGSAKSTGTLYTRLSSILTDRNIRIMPGSSNPHTNYGSALSLLQSLRSLPLLRQMSSQPTPSLSQYSTADGSNPCFSSEGEVESDPRRSSTVSLLMYLLPHSFLSS